MFNFLQFLILKFKSLIYYSTIYWYYKLIFGKLGRKCVIKSTGLRLEYPSNIFLGSKVFVGAYSWLAATPHIISNPKLILSDGVSLGRYNQIYSTTSITIEENVLTADRVFISDSAHNSQNINLAIMFQNITSKGGITIGAGTWIGINACIIGASVGKNCVIGANSVITKNIPDYCIVGGNPAIIIKRFDLDSRMWLRTSKEGKFLD